MYRQLAFLFLIVIFPLIATRGQEIKHAYKRCPFTTLNYKQGLLHNTTEDAITDGFGYTWFATRTGLQRYNGYVFETINPIIGGEVQNINSPVHFFSVKDGSIWISYRQGVLRYEQLTNSFKAIIKSDCSDSENFSVIPFAEIEEGVLCMQKGKGVLLYSKEGKLLRSFTDELNTTIDKILSNPEIVPNTFFAANSHSLYLNAGGGKVQQYNFKTGKLNSFYVAETITNIACTENYILLVSPLIIKLIDGTSKKILKVIKNKSLVSERIVASSIFCSDNGKVLVGLNSRLFEFDSSFNYICEYVTLNGNPYLNQGYIRRIYEGKFQRIWLLTNDDIKRIQNVKVPFEHFFYKGQKNNFVRSLYFDEEKHLLFAGCYNGGIQLYDTLGNALWKEPIVSEQIKDINAIEKVGENNYFISTIKRGWYILDLPEKKITPILEKDLNDSKLNSFKINFANNTQRINDSTILIANDIDVLRCIFKNGKLTKYKSVIPFKNEANNITCFTFGSSGNIWVATTSGTLFRIDNKGNYFKRNIPENYAVRSLAEDAQQNIWVGTDRGLYIFDQQGSLLKTLTVQSGLLNDCIYAILPVKNEPAVFVSSNLGISHVSFDGEIVNYTKETGLQENEFNTQAAIETANGKYYFGGVNGISTFYPSSLASIKDTPILNILHFFVNDTLFNIFNDKIILTYNQNRIQMDFAALGLLNTNEYVYHYRLNGLEAKWQITNFPKGIKYVLQPGEYTFEINCRSIFSSSIAVRKNFLIEIKSPWWQTIWLRIISIFFFMAIVAWVAYFLSRRKYLKRIQYLHVQQEIQQERARISRDLHDNLGAYAAAISSNIIAIQKNNSIINSNIMLQLKNNSQSIISQLNDTIWTLNKENILLTAISDRYKDFLQKIRSNYSEVSINIRENITNNHSLSPQQALHLFRILKEVANNALRHSNCSIIDVYFVSISNSWQVTIADNGKGIAKNNLTEGNGICNLKRRADEAGWNIRWQSISTGGTQVVLSSLKSHTTPNTN
ncbi:MAG: hypothetical protein JST27_00580 [Bacteroidetes bacterium]|nr:hypothetical protein [Bacteroidota bacterium]